ncbi:MAG TPA: chemotaxis protein CheW [Nitrospirota bacterium]|nr:chemotaxis protein CheW [Nitrospirota bacterium]
MAELDNDVTAEVIEVLPEEETRICLFSIGEETYAIPVELLLEIIIPQKIFPVPTTPSHVLGVINLRGSIVPIVDIRPALSLPQQSALGQIAIIKHGATLLGITVDNVAEVIAVNASSIQAIPTDSGGPLSDVKSRSRFFKGIIQRETGAVAILNIERVLDDIKLT